MGAPAARDLNWGVRRGHRESRRKTVYAVGEFSGAPPLHAADHMPHQRLQTVEHILKFGSCVCERGPTKTSMRPKCEGSSSRQQACVPTVMDAVDKKSFRITRIRLGGSRHDRERVRAQQRIASGAVEARRKSDKVDWSSNPSSMGIHSSGSNLTLGARA